MNLRTLLVYFDTSPAAKLLRAGNAAFVVSFLHDQFKSKGTISLPESELLAALVTFQEDVQESWPDRMTSPASTYLAEWREQRWIKRSYKEAPQEATYQLTPAAEQAIEFLDRQHDSENDFVGTECRLRLVIDTLESLVIGASGDPGVHLDHLRHQRDEIDAEIAQIESDGAVTAYHPAKLREQFATAVSLLKQLQGDFRAVEERFRGITQQVQQRQIQGLDSRGGILGGALDAEDELRQDDQGVSFYEFFDFIQSPQQQERLRSIIHQIARIPELRTQTEGLETVRRMKSVLTAEASVVTQTERRLSATLRRLLDVQALRERQRIAELLRDIRGMAAGLVDQPPTDSVRLEPESGVGVRLPLSRTLWTEPPEFELIDLTEHTGDADEGRMAFAEFARLQHLDLTSFRSTIANVLASRGSIPLSQLLDEHPPESGVMDVIGYLQVATEDGHLISDDTSEEIVLRGMNDESDIMLSVPLVTFVERSFV